MADIKAAMAKVERAPSECSSDAMSLLGSQYSGGDDQSDTMTVATEAIADDLSEWDGDDTESVGYATPPRASTTCGAPSSRGLADMSDLASVDPRKGAPSEMGT